METAAKFARIGNRILEVVAVILILLMFLYGGYSLWDTTMIFQNSYVDDDILEFKPVADGSEDNPTLEELQKINPDVKAWITIDETHIDYPVVQGEDDMEYLNKDVKGEFALSGAIFLSCLNQPDFSDQYNLIYGHHMDGGAMFGDVSRFVDADYFKERETGHLFLPDRTYKIRIFACLETHAYDEYVYSPDVQSKNMKAFLAYLKKEAVQYREIDLTETDAIVGLSTCSEATTNGRIVLFGRLEKE